MMEHKSYAEAQLIVMNWKDLMFTFFAFSYFIVFLLSVTVLCWFGGGDDRYVGLFYLFYGILYIISCLYLSLWSQSSKVGKCLSTVYRYIQFF